MLRGQITLGLLCLLIILLAMGLYSIDKCSRLSDRIKSLLRGDDAIVHDIKVLKDDTTQMMAGFLSAVTSAKAPEDLKDVSESRTQFAEVLKRLQGTIVNGNERPLANQIKLLSDAYSDDLQKGLSDTHQPNTISPNTGDIGQEMIKVLNAIDKFADTHQKNTIADNSNQPDDITTTVRLLCLGIIIATVIAIYTTFLLGRGLIDPLVELTRTIKEIGDGNLEQSIPVSSRNEVGQLAASFNRMAAQLKTYRESTSGELLHLHRTLRAALAAFPYPIFVLNSQGTVELRNPEADHLAIKLLFSGVRRLPEKVDEKVDEVRSTGKEYLPTSFKDTIRLQIDENDRYFLPRIVLLKDEKEQTFGIAVILEDVTRMRLLDEVKSNLVATVSHELKTPLTTVRMALYLVLENIVGPLNAKQTELLSTAREDADRLLKTLNDLLDLAKLEHGTNQLDLTPLHPEHLVEIALRDVKEIAASASVTLNSSVPENLPRVLVDQQRIAFVFNNLLTNAIKYSPPNTRVDIRVERCEDDINSIRFSVKDQGPGIKAEQCIRIFDRFYRVPGTKKAGAGLGLFIAKEVVGAHGGKIGVTSVIGDGSEFYFILPCDGANALN